jgi:cobalt/nickel transport system permease protein
MDIIDRFAYNNRLRTVDPMIKASLAGCMILFCLILDRASVSGLTVLWMFLMAVGVARVPPRVFTTVLLTEGLFLTLTTIGIALSITLRDPVGQADWILSIGPLWISSSIDRVRLAGSLVARALGCATAMNFLALTTPLIDLIDVARRLHIPTTLTDMMTVIYRYIFVLLGSLERMRTSQESRLGYVNFKRGMSSAALLATRLFIESYQRSQRLQTALESRGYTDSLRVLPVQYRRDWPMIITSAAIPLSLLIVYWIA